MVRGFSAANARRLAVFPCISTLLPVFQASAMEPEQKTIMKTGGLTSQPIGHYEFCQRSANECRRISLNTRPRVLTAEHWQEVVSINSRINSQVRPVTDFEFFGVEEHWTLPVSDEYGLVGDCEDYVLAKQRELRARGWPAATLLPTVVRRKNGEGHAVLTVRTDRGDFILDNLTDEIRPWNETGYAFLKRVSAAHSGRWESIIDQRTVVSSILD